jgi:drug/metabolite transporter (DMT)-like permease
MKLDPGIVSALAAAVLFGASTPLAKRLIEDIDPWMLAGLLYLGSGIGLALLRLVRRATGSPRALLRREDRSWLALAILAGGVVGPVLMMSGLAHSAASSASLLLNLEAVFTALIAWFVFHENVDRRVAVGFWAITAGAVVLSAGGPLAATNLFGPLAIAGACLAWGIDNNLTRRVSSSDATLIAMLKGLTAGTVNVVIALSLGAHWPAPQALASAAGVGFVGYGLSLVLFVLALRRLGAARTAAYFSMAPFVGAVLALLILHEAITLQLLIAGTLMAVGLWLHLTEQHEHEHEHEPLVHEHTHVHDLHHQHEHTGAEPPGEPHTHRHAHAVLRHRHAHYPDEHHRHEH